MTLKRRLDRAAKFPTDYSGMIGKGILKSADNTCLETVYPYDLHTFSLSSASSLHTRDTYLSEDDTLEDLHPCAFLSKMQANDLDNPAYKDIPRGSAAERASWDETMTKELKGMADLWSFEMVSRPRGANILQSSCAFKRKRFLNGTLKKYKARFCVRGD